MPAKSFFYRLSFFLCFSLNWGWSQQAGDSLTTNLPVQEIKLDSISVVANDSLVKKEPLLLDMIDYTAKDSVRIDQTTNKIKLFNKARLSYQDMELEAGIIVLDYTKNEVYAGRIKDSTGQLVQKPVFIQGYDEINPDSIRFNFDTKKALIWNSKTAQGEMNVFSSYTKKQNDSVYYIKNAKITTSQNPENPDYYIKIRKGKMVPGGKIVAGLSNLFIANVPTPIGLPFAYFPAGNKQESGLVFPTFGESNQRGYYFQNGGYYYGGSELFDLNVVGDYYTNGSYGVRLDSRYKINYKSSGNFSFRWENLVSGEKGFEGYARSSVYNIRWTHRQDPKASPNSTFSASVNLGSSSYFRQSINQLNTPNFLNNNLNSSISYSKSFPKYPRVNISLTANLSQNQNTQLANLTMPTIQANMERIFPFVKKGETKKGIFQNINFQVTTRGESRIQTTEEKLFKPEMFEDARTGVIHTIPISTNFKLFKYLSTSVSANYKEVWTNETVRYNNFTPTAGVVKDTLGGFDAFRQYSYSASIGTTVYGTFNFGEDKKIQSIRHTLRPSISYSIQPSFEQYYDEYIIDAEGNTREYTRFETALFGKPSLSYSNAMGISLSNNFEAKVKDSDTTAVDPKKIKLLNNLNFSTSYNFAAEEFRLAPIRATTGFGLFKDKLSVNLGATFDPYALNEDLIRINKSTLSQGQGLVRLSSANINMNYSFSNETFKSEDKEEEEENDFAEQERLSGGGREDDLFGVANDFSNGNFNRDQKSDAQQTGLYNTIIPWDIKLAYSLTYNNSRGQKDFSNNSLMVSSNVDLTPKWKVGISSGYDFKGKGVTYTQLRFDRDLDSWRLNFSWVPFSNRASWYFFIGIKSGLLSDLKYEKRREPDRRF